MAVAARAASSRSRRDSSIRRSQLRQAGQSQIYSIRETCLAVTGGQLSSGQRNAGAAPSVYTISSEQSTRTANSEEPLLVGVAPERPIQVSTVDILRPLLVHISGMLPVCKQRDLHDGVWVIEAITVPWFRVAIIPTLTVPWFRAAIIPTS